MNTSTFLKILPEEKTNLSYQLRQVIYHAVKEVLGEKTGEKVQFSDIQIEHPKDKNYGDYSTNIAMILAGRLSSRLRDLPPIGRDPAAAVAAEAGKVEARDLAEKIAGCLNNHIKENQSISLPTDSKISQDTIIHLKDILEKVSVAGGRFINMSLSTSFLISQMQGLIKKKESSTLSHMSGIKIAVEYTDPNPFKEFHLGHMYSNFIGESVSRIFEACGASVWRGDFYGDVGMHAAKSVYGFLAKLKTQPFDFAQGKSLKLKALQGDDYIKELKRYTGELSKLPIGKRQKLLGEGYALGVVKYDEDKIIQEEIKDINYLIYIAAQEVLKREKGWQPIINYRQYLKGEEARLEEIQILYEAGLKWSLEYFETIYRRLGTKFDGYYPESLVGEYGMKMVEKGLEKNILERSQGGVIYRGEQDGLHTRVFVNKLGLPTYEAKDLGLVLVKYGDFKYDLSINVFGKEIDEYYKVVKAAMMKIEPFLGNKAYYIAHGMVKLPQGKMSSRTGSVVTFEWLIEEVKARIKEIMFQTSKKAVRHFEGISMPASADRDSFEMEELGHIAEKAAIAAVRYSLLRQSIGEDIVFDFDKSISFEGDSGPYLMYTYARCKSVLRKAQGSGVRCQVSGVRDELVLDMLKPETYNLKPNPEELSLLRLFYRFPEVVAEAARTFSPNFICSFLFELAQTYNLFYQKHSILGVRDQVSGIRCQGSGVRDEQVLNLLKPEIQNPKPETYNLKPVHSFRLSLTSATANILKQGLYLLGIETVERM